MLRTHIDQLLEVFTNIFNLFLSQAVVPAFLKSTIITPEPIITDQHQLITNQGHLHPSKQLVFNSHHIILTATLDQHTANRLREDVITTDLYTAQTHLEHMDYIDGCFL